MRGEGTPAAVSRSMAVVRASRKDTNDLTIEEHGGASNRESWAEGPSNTFTLLAPLHPSAAPPDNESPEPRRWAVACRPSHVVIDGLSARCGRRTLDSAENYRP